MCVRACEECAYEGFRRGGDVTAGRTHGFGGCEGEECGGGRARHVCGFARCVCLRQTDGTSLRRWRRVKQRE